MRSTTMDASEPVPREVWLGIGFAVVVGIALRSVQAFEDRALWLDEAMLALNIRRLSFSELCGPLQYDQAAPVGFLWLQKLATFVVSGDEISARVVPWTAGCLCLLIFTKLMIAITGRKALLPVAAMAFSPTLICYSGEGKQYSVDVLVSVMALFVGLRWIKFSTGRVALQAALFCAIAPWMSHTGVFFLPGVLMLAVAYRNQTGWAMTCACAMLVLTSVLMLFFVNVRKVYENPSLNNFWQSDYVPWRAIGQGPTEFFTVVSWMLRKWWEFVVRCPGLAPDVDPGTAAWFAGAGVTILMTWVLFRAVSDTSSSAFLAVKYTILPPVTCLVAAALEIYPFGNRLLLFAAPLIFALLGQMSLTTAWSSLRRFQMDVLLSAILVSWPLASACESIAERKGVRNMFAPHYEEDIRPFLALMQNSQPSQKNCYVFHAARPAFEYYSRDQTEHVFFGSPGDSDHYRDEVKLCLSDNHTWLFLYAHTAPWGSLEPYKAYEYLKSQNAEEIAPTEDDVRLFVAKNRQMAARSRLLTVVRDVATERHDPSPKNR